MPDAHAGSLACGHKQSATICDQRPWVQLKVFVSHIALSPQDDVHNSLTLMFLSAEPLIKSVESLLMSRVVAGSLWPYRLRKNFKLQGTEDQQQRE